MSDEIFKVSSKETHKRKITIIEPTSLDPDTPLESDFVNTVNFRTLITNLIKNKRINIIFSMKNIPIISSYTTGVFVTFHRELNNRRGKIVFCNLEKRV